MYMYRLCTFCRRKKRYLRPVAGNVTNVGGGGGLVCGEEHLQKLYTVCSPMMTSVPYMCMCSLLILLQCVVSFEPQTKFHAIVALKKKFLCVCTFDLVFVPATSYKAELIMECERKCVKYSGTRIMLIEAKTKLNPSRCKYRNK
jgi:hypothetical protein